MRRVDERRLQLAKPPVPHPAVLTPAAVADLPAVHPDELELLRFLARSPQLWLVTDLAVELNVSRRTIGKRVAYLEADELIHRPRGPRSGLTLTPLGRLRVRTAAKSAA